MGTNNWRPAQADPAMDGGDWRTQLPPDSRQTIVNNIMDTLKRSFHVSGQEGLHELRTMAVRFEEKIYTAATSQPDYLQTISLQMQQVMVTNFQNAMPGNPPDPASLDSTAQTGTTNVGDWQEEVYQKIKIMKEMYLPDLNEIHQKIAAKLQQHDSLPQQPKTEQLEKLKIFKAMLERMIAVLQVSKNSITPHFKEKLSGYEKQIVNFINIHRPRKPVPPLQHGQLPLPLVHSMQQPQQSQSQLTQGQPHENQMNPQLQPMNLQGSVATMQQNNLPCLQPSSMSSLSGLPNAQQNIMNSLQSSANLDPGQGNALTSLQQAAVGALQQCPVSAPQQANINNLSSQNGVNVLQQNINQFQRSNLEL